jgi:hypothetical protein
LFLITVLTLLKFGLNINAFIKRPLQADQMSSYPDNLETVVQRGDIEAFLRATPTFGKKFESSGALNIPAIFSPRGITIPDAPLSHRIPLIPKHSKKLALYDGFSSPEPFLQSPSKLQQPYLKLSPAKPEIFNLKSQLISHTEPTELMAEPKIMKPIKLKKQTKSFSSQFRPPKPIDVNRRVLEPLGRMEVTSSKAPLFPLQNTLTRAGIQISPRSPNLTINKTLSRHQRHPSGSNLPIIDTNLRFELPQIPHTTQNATSKNTLRNLKFQFRLDAISNIQESGVSEELDTMYFPKTKFQDPDSTRTGSRVEGSTTILDENDTPDVKKSIQMPQIPLKSGSHGCERKKVKIPPISREIPEVFRIYSKQETRTNNDNDSCCVLQSPRGDIPPIPKYSTIGKKHKSSKALILPAANEEKFL